MKHNFKVYLSGPITGLLYKDAVAWTDYAKEELAKDGINGYRPLRGKEFLKDYKELDAQGYLDANPLGTPKGIVGRDRYDVHTSDCILVNLLGAQRVSIGTVFEIAWAEWLYKPIVLVMEKEGNIHEHGMILEYTLFC